MNIGNVKFVTYNFEEGSDLSVFDRWITPNELLSFLISTGKPFLIDRSYAFAIFIEPARSQDTTRIHLALNPEETAKKILQRNYPQVYNAILSPNTEYSRVFNNTSYVDIVVQFFGLIYVDYFGIKTRFDIGDVQKLLLSILDINGYFDRTHLGLSNINYLQHFDYKIFKGSGDCCRLELEVKGSKKRIYRYMCRINKIFPLFQKPIQEYVYRCTLHGTPIDKPEEKFWYVNASLQVVGYFDITTQEFIECNI